MRQIKWLTGIRILLPALLIIMLLQACQNDLNQVKQISALEVNTPIDTTKGVELIYSDSAKVKSRVTAILMLRHNVAQPFYEMPKGVKITFFDDKMNMKGLDANPEKHILAVVTSDYAITSNNDKLIELRKNVKLVNTEGDIFTTEQLFYDINKKLIYSDKACRFNKADGTDLEGTSFKSNESFTDYTFANGHGPIATKGNLLQ